MGELQVLRATEAWNDRADRKSNCSAKEKWDKKKKKKRKIFEFPYFYEDQL